MSNKGNRELKFVEAQLLLSIVHFLGESNQLTAAASSLLRTPMKNLNIVLRLHLLAWA